MITKEYAEGLTEVLTILDNAETEYSEKIPKQLMAFFRENAANDYTPNIDTSSEIKDMNLKKETKQILSIIYMNYWTKNEEEKNEFKSVLKENQRLIDEEIREKYNPDKIFENKSEIPIKSVSAKPVLPEESLVEYKPSFWKNFISKIKEWVKGVKRDNNI